MNRNWRLNQVVIDEIQRKPDLFPLLRVLADRKGQPANFLILGSASPDLLQKSSESLAPWWFSLSLLTKNDSDSWKWRQSFIRTFLERDIPQMGISTPSITIRRFWTMLAHYHGQIFNASEIARSMNVSQTTASGYLDILSAVFMVWALQPWHANLKKRQVKRPGKLTYPLAEKVTAIPLQDWPL